MTEWNAETEWNLAFSPGDSYAGFAYGLPLPEEIELAFCPGAGPADNSCSPTGGVHGVAGPGSMDTGGGTGGASVGRSNQRAVAAASKERILAVNTKLTNEHQKYILRAEKAAHPGIEALDEYTQSGHEQMNSILRNPGTYKPTAYERTHIENLENLIENAPPLPEDVVVVRGAGRSGNKDWKVGQVIEDRGFMSTSFAPKTATAFSRGDQSEPGALLKILVPKGMKGIIPWHTAESELLLQRGTRLKIIKVKEKQGAMGYFGRKIYKIFYAIARPGVRRKF